MNVSLKELKEISEKKRDCIIMYNYRRISRLITYFLIKTNITPNQVTLVSILFALVSIPFFYFGTYVNLVIGAVLFQLSYLFDVCDGEIARAKKLTSNSGAWLDGISDDITQSLIFIAMVLGAYNLSKNVNVLIVGIFLIHNHAMIKITPALGGAPKEHKEFSIGKKFYIGGTSVFFLVTIFSALFNQVYNILLITSIITTPIWIKQFFTKYHLMRKEEIN